MADMSQEATEELAVDVRHAAWATPRRMFILLAIVLAIILAFLIFYLLWFLGRPEVLTNRQTAALIQPIWQVYGPAEGDTPLFDGPMGVAVGRDGRIYVTDSGNNRVSVFDLQGRFLFSFGEFGAVKTIEGVKPSYEPGRLNYPVGIDTDAAGNVYVASFYNDSIEVFDADGNPLRRFPDPAQPAGKGGSGTAGGGIAVTDVAVSGDRLYATDMFQIFVFSLDGEVLDQWGKPGNGPGDLDHPNGLAVSGDGQTVYVSDSNHSRVTAFTTAGEVLWQVGEISGGLDDRSTRTLEHPRGLAVLPDDSILVVDALGFELVRISPDGEVDERFGERGTEPGMLNFANDATALRGFVLVADKGNGRVQMVRLTR
jgi:sugar lactone lactonase YvrE